MKLTQLHATFSGLPGYVLWLTVAILKNYCKSNNKIFIQVLVGFGTALQGGRSRVRFPMGVIEIFHVLNPSGRTMVLGST
jgi:hypothetical protein